MTRTIIDPKANGLPASLRMSEDDYERWAFETERPFETEWVDGEVRIMAPISNEHDDLQAWIRVLLDLYGRRKNLGRAKGPEYQIRLSTPSRREPDVLFVATEHLHRIQKTHLKGPPDLAMEIISPGTAAIDYREKYLEYQTAGIKEYWIIDPLAQRIEAYLLGADGVYQQMPEQNDKIESSVVAGWYLRPSWLWASPQKDLLEALKELGIQ